MYGVCDYWQPCQCCFLDLIHDYDCTADGVPQRTQPRFPPPDLEGLQGIPSPSQGYRYVILSLWFITITRRSIGLGIATASLTFVALQVCLNGTVCACSNPGALLFVQVPALTLQHDHEAVLILSRQLSDVRFASAFVVYYTLCS